MVPQVVGFVVPAFHIARTEQDDIGQQTALNRRFKHLKIGGYQGNMVVESNTITHRSEGVEHPRITQCIAQTVKPVEEENGSFVAPLEGVENGIHFLALGQNIVARCLRRKKGVRLRFRKSFGRFCLGVGKSKHAEQRHATFGEFNPELYHGVRVR